MKNNASRINKSILFLPGDGIGPEVVAQGVKILTKVGEVFGHQFTYIDGLIGADALDKTGDPLPQETLDSAKKADAVLLGAVGDPKYDDPTLKIRPEQGLLKLRKELDLFANIRPIKLFDALVDRSPVKAELVKGTDMLFFRELTGGIYFGKPSERRENGTVAVDTSIYSIKEIERIARLAFAAAQKRSKKVVSIDKANVLETSRLWREVVTDVAKDFSDVSLEHMLVDSASMRLIKQPTYFDVILTENMFGDILTDEASQLAGSMGLIASASMGSGISLYEPIHGSAPKMKGQNKANPIATILSVALMLRYSFNVEKEAVVVERAVEEVLKEGHRTYDIAGEGSAVVGTDTMGSLIREKISI